LLILPIDDAQAGMRLAAPVAHPEQPDQTLLKAGYVLEQRVLDRVREMGVGQLYVDFPGLDDLDKHLLANLSPARQQIYNQVKATITAGQKRTRAGVSYHDYYASVRELVLTIVSQGQHPVYVEHIARLGGDAVTHATAVAHLGLVLGMKLERYLIDQRKRLSPQHAREVVNIGVAGMLHDMGKLALPEDVRRYTAVDLPGEEAELGQYQSHAAAGYEMIRHGVEPSAAAAVLHHHQRWDGRGFPRATPTGGAGAVLGGERIHIFARIVGVADLYDRLAARADTPVRRPSIEVLHLMQTRYAAWCDPAVLEVLASVAPPFPPGEIVTLSDATAAVVVDLNAKDPYRPIVKRLAADLTQVTGDRLDLRLPGAPTITHVGRTAVGAYVAAGVALAA
jgi:response regulator RpfG family c-di-GMP phosphodiesterase